MIPSYVQYKYDVAEPKDAFEMMNEHLLSILRKFDYAQDSKGKTQYFSQEGNIVIEYDAEGKAIVYSKAGEKVCHAFIDNKGICEGWAKLFSEGTLLYEGAWRNYKRHGQGIDYLNDYGDYQYVSKEGTWEDGELWNGVIHDVLVNSDGTLIDDDEDIIQINEQFHRHKANFIEDFGAYSIADLIVEEGEFTIDPASPLREVKPTYESKYGEVEWSDSYSYEEVNTPNINVLINETNELKLAFNPAIEINRLSLPAEIMQSDITSHLSKYVTEEEVESYNAKIPDTIKKIETYNKELETYKFAEAFGLELNLSIINEGSLKANDIHIELDLPDEVLILEGSKKSLEEPEAPILPHSPIDKALFEMAGFGAIQSATGLLGRMGFGAFSHSNIYKNDKLLRNFVTGTNPNYWTHLDGNTISVHCAELLHTRKRTFDSEYLLVPTKAGAYDINVSVICEEYVEEDAFTIQMIVEDFDVRIEEESYD